MTQRRQERILEKSLLNFFASRLTGDSDIMLPKEQEQLAEQDIMKEIVREYEPLDEASLRIIELKTRVTGAPRWYHALNERVTELREMVSELQKQISELMEAVKERAEVCGATIYELGNNQYELTMPLQIVLEEDEEETVARIPELNLYASADTDSEAIHELKQEVIKLYEDLESSDRKLGPLPKSWLETLRKLIVRKNG